MPDACSDGASQTGRSMKMNQPIVAISFKMYFTRKQTLDYCHDLVRILKEASFSTKEVTMAVLPDYLTLDRVGMTLLPMGIQLGVQDICDHDRGAFTGEVSACDAAALGVSLAEIGHGERRRLYGEDDRLIRRKAEAAWRNGLTPLLCVGEETRRTPSQAAGFCLEQIRSVLGEEPARPAWIAYEPIWAVGARQAAPVEYVTEVCSQIKAELGQMGSDLAIIYGGAAGPGLLTRLWPHTDGVFLGRFAHDPAVFASVVREASLLKGRFEAAS